MLTLSSSNGSNSDGSSSGFEDTLQLQVVLLSGKGLHSFPNPEYTTTIPSTMNDLTWSQKPFRRRKDTYVHTLCPRHAVCRQWKVGERPTQLPLLCVFQAYSSRDLRGLKVEHQLEDFKEDRGVILTIKDAGERTRACAACIDNQCCSPPC